MSIENLQKLREPFPPHQISKLPKPTKKDAPKGKCQECGGYHGLPAVHLDYVGHAALTDRLLDVDPAWHWEPLAIGQDGLPVFDKSGGLWIKLTVCGVTRMGYGNAEGKSYMDIGSREKEVIGDALRNSAMRFGAALDLWHKGDLHVDEEEKKDEGKGKGVIKATDGAKLNLTVESIEKVEKTASAMVDWLNQGAVDDAVLTGENAELDPEEKVFLWTFFDSKQRSAMKKAATAMKEKQTETA